MNPTRHHSRRQFLCATSGAALSAAVLGPFTIGAPPAPERPKKKATIALIATEVRKHSHAQHFIDRFVEGYGWHGRHHYPAVELGALYVDQFPEGDLSRDRAKRHGLRLYPSVQEAITRGTSRLAVDGVVIIGEHGKYPRNEKGQTLYPRHRFFTETVEVFERSKRSVPVFNDKHLSTRWDECVEMVQTARRLDFPFLAGSSLPVTWRIPGLEIPLDTPLVESVCVCYGGVDSYDFHGLETAQCMSERRRGGESGISTVRALRGPAVWERLEQSAQTRDLFAAALARSFTMRAAAGYTSGSPSLEAARHACTDPVAYFFEHRDGFRTAMFLMNGLVTDFTYAGRRRDGEIVSCQMFLPMPGSVSTTADFFNPLVNHIETLVLKRKTPYPVERTLLTSGMTLFAVESLFRGQAQLPTPELAVAYRAVEPSAFWRA
ncbi:MAG: hypothetical protein U1G07_18000 [Verrucomicrobiota bacterium]